MPRFDVSSLVILGESLAAGLVNFSLHADDQQHAFPNLVAERLGARLAGPRFRPPGVGEAVGFPKITVHASSDDPAALLIGEPGGHWRNLAIPGLTIEEAIGRRPAAPVIQSDDPRQTVINLLLGADADVLPSGRTARPTALERALALQPTLAIVALGFAELMDAATTGSKNRLLTEAIFRDRYASVVAALRKAGADVVVATIPDPMDTPHCSTLVAAARLLKMPVSQLQRDYRLRADDRIHINGLVEIGVQIMESRVTALAAGVVIDGATAAAISEHVRALNTALADIAHRHGAALADFAAVYRAVAGAGIRAGSRTLTNDLLGGFFSLNGYTPGATGQAALANAVLEAIGRASGQQIAPIDLNGVAASDPVADYRPAEGPAFRTMAGRLAAFRAGMRFAAFLVGFVAKAVVGGITRKKEPRRREQGNAPETWTLTLPPRSRQTLPIDSRSSYYGDALLPVHTTDRDEQRLGLTDKLLFGGYGLFDSRLHGKVRIAFEPPVNNISHFEITHPGGLKGDDTRLTAPIFFKLAGVKNQVMDSTSLVSAGDLNLVTGEVTNLKYTLFLLNSAILALAATTPALPKDPIAFPGTWGRAWARFDQRRDGLLDYTCYVTSFIPLSVLNAPVRFPLPFTGPSGSVASIPADGTALHPHFSVSTRPPAQQPGSFPTLQTATVREMTTASGRYRVQFGTNFGSAISLAIMPLPPSVAPSDPVSDDRLNVPVAAIDVETGQLMPQSGSRASGFDVRSL